MCPEICPNCGAEVPPQAKACPECGSDEQTGWSDQARNAALGLPEEDFDYEEFVQREFGPARPVRSGLSWYWWLVAVGLILLFVGFYLRWWF